MHEASLVACSMQPDTVASSASVCFVMTMCVLLATVYYPGHQSKSYRLGLHSTMASVCLVFMNYDE